MDKMDKLFSEYEQCFGKLDFSGIAALYSDAFISAGPKGTIANSKKDFIAQSARASDVYKGLGMNAARILSRYELSISDEYSLVTIRWSVNFAKADNTKMEFDVSYVVQKIGEEPKITLFITHQDEEEAIKKLGLFKESQN